MNDLPLSERILAKLPGPRVIWILLWATLVVTRPFVYTWVVRWSGNDVGWDFLVARLVPDVVLAYMVLVALWAGGRFVRDLRAMASALDRLVDSGPGSTKEPPLQGMGSIWGPLLLTGGLTLILTINLIITRGLAVALLMLPLVVVVDLPLMTSFWGYIMLLIGLDRLGRMKLSLEPFPQDPSLGLRPVGTLAATGFWVFCAMAVPFLLIAVRSRLDLVLGLTTFLVGVFIFFLSMARLHRQMVAAKHRHLAWARHIYAQAFGPVRPAGTLDALRAQAPLLSAAEALEKRALAIQEWPFDERTNSRIAAAVTGVTIGAISRLVLRSLGM